jgi:putative alpha-1,2-mannosidase
MVKYISILINIFFFWFHVPALNPKKLNAERLTDFVDPFIGTAYHGHTFPGAAYPFGQVQLSPDNGTQGWDWCSGYHYSDSTLAGFSHLHLSGTGIGDLADISFLPVTSEVTFKGGEKKILISFHAMQENILTIRKSQVPGITRLQLKTAASRAEFTVTERVGFHKYTFPSGWRKGLIINLGFAINWDKPYKTGLTRVDDKTLTGYRLSEGWAADQHVYFAVRFSGPVTEFSHYKCWR